MASVIESIRRQGVVARLICLNVAIFVIVGLSMLGAKAELCSSLEPWVVLDGYISETLRRPWTLITYMFTHISPLHLIVNMLWLAWFGSLLLMVKSQRYLLWLYIAGGVAGGVLYVLLCPVLNAGFSHLVGASASVLAIMVVAALKLPTYRVHLFFIGDVKLKWIAIGMILLAFLGLGGGDKAGVAAHLGGALCGLIAGFLPVKIAGGEKNVKKNKRKIKPKCVQSVISVMEQHRLDVQRLDELLDKIRISGFDSLSESEKSELRQLSKHVSK